MRRHRLHAAQRQDRVGAAEVERVEDVRVDACPRYGRRAGDDVVHARAFAVVTLMTAEAICAYRPPGT